MERVYLQALRMTSSALKVVYLLGVSGMVRWMDVLKAQFPYPFLPFGSLCFSHPGLLSVPQISQVPMNLQILLPSPGVSLSLIQLASLYSFFRFSLKHHFLKEALVDPRAEYVPRKSSQCLLDFSYGEVIRTLIIL